jgi:hypothetical protein
MNYEKEDKKTIIFYNPSPVSENKKNVKKLEPIPKQITQHTPYISFDTIKDIFTTINNSLYNDPSNKKFMSILKTHKIDAQEHDLEHFINFCRHIAYKISCYKSQDRHKLKGDYTTHVIKDHHETIPKHLNSKIEQFKSIHTDSYNYIDNSLYENKYFTIYTFIKLFIYSNGMCFYCNNGFDITLTDKYMDCKYKTCMFHISPIKSNTNMHDKTRQLRWSLERINNTLGHYQNNCVLACLGCNLKRRNKNHQSFKFTQTLSLNKTE